MALADVPLYRPETVVFVAAVLAAKRA